MNLKGKDYVFQKATGEGEWQAALLDEAEGGSHRAVISDSGLVVHSCGTKLQLDVNAPMCTNGADNGECASVGP